MLLNRVHSDRTLSCPAAYAAILCTQTVRVRPPPSSPARCCCSTPQSLLTKQRETDQHNTYASCPPSRPSSRSPCMRAPTFLMRVATSLLRLLFCMRDFSATRCRLRLFCLASTTNAETATLLRCGAAAEAAQASRRARRWEASCNQEAAAGCAPAPTHAGQETAGRAGGGSSAGKPCAGRGRMCTSKHFMRAAGWSAWLAAALPASATGRASGSPATSRCPPIVAFCVCRARGRCSDRLEKALQRELAILLLVCSPSRPAATPTDPLSLLQQMCEWGYGWRCRLYLLACPWRHVCMQLPSFLWHTPGSLLCSLARICNTRGEHRTMKGGLPAAASGAPRSGAPRSGGCH